MENIKPSSKNMSCTPMVKKILNTNSKSSYFEIHVKSRSFFRAVWYYFQSVTLLRAISTDSSRRDLHSVDQTVRLHFHSCPLKCRHFFVRSALLRSPHALCRGHGVLLSMYFSWWISQSKASRYNRNKYLYSTDGNSDLLKVKRRRTGPDW